MPEDGGRDAASFLAEQKARLAREARERTVGFIVAAFGLVAGLAWNDAIGALIADLFPLERSGIIAKFIYAIVITAVVVFVTTIITRPPQQD
jgi:hypothetical protein